MEGGNEFIAMGVKRAERSGHGEGEGCHCGPLATVSLCQHINNTETSSVPHAPLYNTKLSPINILDGLFKYDLARGTHEPDYLSSKNLSPPAILVFLHTPTCYQRFQIYNRTILIFYS